MQIEMGKKYTSGGEPIRILCTDRNDTYQVLGMYDNGRLLSFDKDGKSALMPFFDLQEFWEPSISEWCWFWDNNSKGVAVHISMYSRMIGASFESADGRVFDCCSKFNGELPGHLKGK